MIPELLYHKTRIRQQDRADTLSAGLIPQKPDEWKYLIPEQHRGKKIVWLKENYNSGDIIIHTKMLDKRNLRRLHLRDKNIRWWTYTGKIPMEAITL